MPIRYEIDPFLPVIRVSAVGEVTAEEFREHCERLAADPSFDPLYSQLTDLRDLASPHVCLGALQAAIESRLFFAGARRAIVVATTEQLRTARSFADQSSDEAHEVRVFLDLLEAEAWLAL